MPKVKEKFSLNIQYLSSPFPWEVNYSAKRSVPDFLIFLWHFEFFVCFHYVMTFFYRFLYVTFWLLCDFFVTFFKVVRDFFEWFSPRFPLSIFNVKGKSSRYALKKKKSHASRKVYFKGKPLIKNIAKKSRNCQKSKSRGIFLAKSKEVCEQFCQGKFLFEKIGSKKWIFRSRRGGN